MIMSIPCFTNAAAWNDLQYQRQIQKALMVFKSLNGLVPEYLTFKYVTRKESERLPKQRNSYFSSSSFLCFESPTALLALQYNLFRTM